MKVLTLDVVDNLQLLFVGPHSALIMVALSSKQICRSRCSYKALQAGKHELFFSPRTSRLPSAGQDLIGPG